MRLTEIAINSVRARLEYVTEHRDRLVIDGDVHPTPEDDIPDAMRRRMAQSEDYFHGRALVGGRLPDLMDEAGVDMALCWQNPATLTYTDDSEENLARLTRANKGISALAAKFPTRIIPGGWTDPKALGTQNAVALAQRCVTEFGMPIVKMNPAQNGYPLDDEMVMTVVDAIVELGAVPAFHYGSDTPFTPPEALRRVAARHSDHPVIGVHMGGGGGGFVEAEPIYQQTLALGRVQPNLFFVMSAMREVYAETAMASYALAGNSPANNLAMGSDAPYCSMKWVFAGARAFLADDPQAPWKSAHRQRFLGRNLADLVIAADERLLAL